MQSVQVLTNITKDTQKVSQPCASTPDKPWSTTYTISWCLMLQNQEWSSTKISLARPTRSANTIKFSFQKWTGDRWNTSGASLTMKLTFSKVRLQLWQSCCVSQTLICTSLPICGSETWSQWNGGTISGWMNPSQHSWLTYAWKDLREFHNLRIHAGFNFWKNLSGVFQRTNFPQPIQSVAKSVAQMKPRHCLMASRMEKALLSWSNYSTCLATRQWAKVWPFISVNTNGKILNYQTSSGHLNRHMLRAVTSRWEKTSIWRAGATRGLNQVVSTSLNPS